MVRTIPASEADTEFLFKVYVGTRRDEVAGWGWEPVQQEAFLRMQFSFQRRSYDLYPGADRRTIWHDSCPVGSLMVGRTDSEIRLIDIALLPEYQNAGIGTAVIRELQDEAAAAGKPLCLSVAVGNPARRLYERLGFAVTGETGTHYAMQWHHNNA